MFINIVSLFFFLNAIAAQAQEDAVHAPCVDWESNAEAYEEAYAQWTAPSCYTFRYQYKLQEVITGGAKRTVKNGKPVEVSPYKEIETLDEFWNMIQANCIQGCPTSGAHKCNIAYTMSEDGSFMFPTLLDIHHNSTVSYDTSQYLIFDVSTIACSDEEEIVDAVVEEPCVDWETTATAYEKAIAQWEVPSCYTFTYTFLGYFPKPPKTRTVVRGQSLQVKEESWDDFQTIDDFWSLIYRQCIESCPDYGAHLCDIEFAMNEESGFMYPALINIDQYSTSVYDTLTYSIDDVRAIPCPEEDEIRDKDEEILDGVNELCVNSEATAAAYSEAFVQWEAPLCYTFTYSFGEKEARTRTVLRGVPVQDKDDPYDLYLQTIDEYYNMIWRRCISDCSTSGVHSCDVAYATKEQRGFVYPELLVIDEDSRIVDDELVYRIEEVRAIPCPGDALQEEVEQEEETSDNKKTKKNKKDKKEKNTKESNPSLRKKGKCQKK